MSNRTGNQLLMSGGAAPKGIAYKVLGQEYGGRVLAEPEKYPQREYDKNNPGGGKIKTFPDGNPMEGVNIDVATSERDDRTDDGTRRFYVEKVRERQAIADAIRAAGSELVEIGAYLFVTWTGEEEGKGVEPAKTFSARYIPAAQVPLMNAADLEPRKARPAESAPISQRPSTGKQKVPREVFVAMINAGLDISGFEMS